MKTLSLSAKTELSDVFARFSKDYREKNKINLQQSKTLFAIENCRTSVLGGHIDKCESCDYLRISYNSCRNRHCPKCQKLNKEIWVDKLSSSLLPVRYFHMVFTIPNHLNRICLVNQKCMYDILFKAASQTILQLSRDKNNLGATTGIVAVLHTWGQNLMDHPHLHTMIPAGGWSEFNGYWKSSKKKFFLPVRMVSEVFRGKFLSILKQSFHNKDLKFIGETELFGKPENFQKLISDLYKINWVVFCKKPFRNSSAIINYLGKYSHKVAISNERIIKIENDSVFFKWKDYKEKGKHKIMSLSSNEFIRRFLLHVLPSGFFKIRYFGLFASRNKKLLLAKCKKAMGIKDKKSIYQGLSKMQILKIVSGIDPEICPCCKNGKMKPVIELKFPP